MKTPDEIYDILDKALTEKKATGCTIKERGGWPHETNICCAAQAKAGNDYGYTSRLAEELGVTVDEVELIIAGFDGDNGAGPHYDVGQRLRAKYIN